MKEQAEEKNVMYNDARQQGDYANAANDLDWLLENTPELNPSLYINGAKIYAVFFSRPDPPDIGPGGLLNLGQAERVRQTLEGVDKVFGLAVWFCWPLFFSCYSPRSDFPLYSCQTGCASI